MAGYRHYGFMWKHLYVVGSPMHVIVFVFIIRRQTLLLPLCPVFFSEMHTEYLVSMTYLVFSTLLIGWTQCTAQQ